MATTLTGSVVDGVYTKTAASQEATASLTSTTSTSKTADSGGTEYNQEMFLQLLVAEMQYQDPLEPTSNTEYVAELASFSQIEAIQGVEDQMSNLQANSLVGQYAIVIDDNNEYVSGKVDYVYNDSGEYYLAINDQLYSLDNLDSVVDEEYYNAVLTVESFTNAIKKLPTEAGTTLQDEDDIVACRTMYDDMDDYTKGFVASETLKTLETLEARIKALKATDTDDSSDTSDDSETTEATEE